MGGVLGDGDCLGYWMQRDGLFQMMGKRTAGNWG